MSMIGKIFNDKVREEMDQERGDEIVHEIGEFTKIEQPVKEYKNRIYEVEYERFGLQGIPMGRGTIEVLGEKKVYADALIKQIKQIYQSLFSGTKAVVFQFNDNMSSPSDRGKRILVTSAEMGFDND